MKVTIEYFAVLREQAKISSETFVTHALDAKELFIELNNKYKFSLEVSKLKVAINEEYCDFSTKICDGDTIVFIPPVAGG